MSLRQLFLDRFVEAYRVLAQAVGPRELEGPLLRIFLQADAAPADAEAEAWFQSCLVRAVKKQLFLRRWLRPSLAGGLAARSPAATQPGLVRILAAEGWSVAHISSALAMSPELTQRAIAGAPPLARRSDAFLPPAGMHLRVWDRIEEASAAQMGRAFSPKVSAGALLASVLLAALGFSASLLFKKGVAPLALLTGGVTAFENTARSIDTEREALPEEVWIRIDQPSVLAFHGGRVEARKGSLLWFPAKSGEAVLVERGELRAVAKEESIDLASRQATASAQAAALRISVRRGSSTFVAEVGSAVIWPESSETATTLHDGERLTVNDPPREKDAPLVQAQR